MKLYGRAGLFAFLAFLCAAGVLAAWGAPSPLSAHDPHGEGMMEMEPEGMPMHGKGHRQDDPAFRERMEKRLAKMKEALKRIEELEGALKNAQGEERVKALEALVTEMVNHHKKMLEMGIEHMERKLEKKGKKEKPEKKEE